MMSKSKITDIFIKNTCGKQLKCTICDCWLPSNAEKFVQSHFTGRKHKQKLHKKNQRENVLKCSVYVKCFDPHLERLEEELKIYFESFEVKVSDVYVDKNTASYSIIQFEKSNDVDVVVNADHKLFHGKKIIIKRREILEKKETHHKTLLSDAISPPCASSGVCLLPTEIQAGLSKLTNQSAQFKALQDYYKLSPADLEVRKLLCVLLQNVLEEIHPGCKVKLFGSSVNGLGIKGSDVDMTLLLSEAVSKEEEIMTEVREIVQRFAPGCKNVSIVQSAKVCTIVKFLHTDSKVNVDLSLNNRLALKNTKLIQTYLQIDQRAKLLIYAIRIWAKCYNLIGRNSLQITSYAMTLIGIHYLQQLDPPLLPCLQQCSEADFIGPWNCGFAVNTTFSSENVLTIGQLLSGFFVYFADFLFDSYGIVIHSTNKKSRTECQTAANKVKDSELNIDAAVLIQDPFKLSHNVAQNLSAAGLKLLVSMFTKASKIICDSAESIIKLFTPEKAVKTRTKQKQKRNRSNVYAITLPNCLHATGEDVNSYCYEFATNVLVDDLAMNVVSINCCGVNPAVNFTEQKTETSPQDTDAPGQDTGSPEHDTDAPRQDTDAPSKKRKWKSNICNEDFVSKKIKLDKNNEGLSLTVCAYTDTWTNRRKHRRQQHLEKNNGRIDNSMTVVNNVKDYSTLDALFSFIIHIETAKSDKDVCKLSVELINGTNNVQQFQTFYAYFKKELMSVFK